MKRFGMNSRAGGCHARCRRGLGRPQYPAELQQLGIQGAVVMRAVISINGDLLNVEAVNSDVDARLVTAALDAVRIWKYSLRY